MKSISNYLAVEQEIFELTELLRDRSISPELRLYAKTRRHALAYSQGPIPWARHFGITLERPVTAQATQTPPFPRSALYEALRLCGRVHE